MANGKYHKRKKHKQLLIPDAGQVPEEPSSPPSPPSGAKALPTIGSDRVRLNLHQGEVQNADEIKDHTRHLINLCQFMKGAAHPQALELERLCSLAQEQYEIACMWAVKAATL